MSEHGRPLRGSAAIPLPQKLRNSIGDQKTHFLHFFKIGLLPCCGGKHCLRGMPTETSAIVVLQMKVNNVGRRYMMHTGQR